MLQKLQHRSTFSCTDRTRKEEGAKGGERELSRTKMAAKHQGISGTDAGPALEGSAQVSELCLCMCALK